MADNSRMDPQGFNEISRLRASDADRDRAASVVNNAMHITGTCVMGGVDVKRKARRQRKEKGRMPRIEQ